MYKLMRTNARTSSLCTAGSLILPIVVGLINSFFYSNRSVMAIMCIVEVCILAYSLITKKYVQYLCNYIVFLCFSMESENFVGTNLFYGFKNFRILGLNLSIWAFIPIFFVSLMLYRNVKGRLTKNIRCFNTEVIAFVFVGLIMSVFTFISNDNGFASAPNSFTTLVQTVYSYLVVLMYVFAFSVILTLYPNDVGKLKSTLLSIIVGTAIVFLACLMLHNYGNRGGLSSLQVSDVYFLLQCTIVLLIYKFSTRDKAFIVVSSIIILVLSLAFNASGKIVLAMLFTPAIFILLMVKKGMSGKKLLALVFVVLLTAYFAIDVLPKLLVSSKLLSYKFTQAIGMLKFGENWFETMPDSPKTRIVELVTILNEYLHKPWYILTGKGFCGSITDSLGLFKNLNMGSAYSDFEMSIGAYSTMHETFNRMLLICGGFGCFLFIKWIRVIIKHIIESPWLVMGLMWILLYFGYHLTISIYGIASLILGFYEIDHQKYGERLVLKETVA